MKLGCIGDDFTGSSDLANTLTRQGMRSAVYVGVPDGPAEAEIEAGVVALKSRSIPAQEAVRLSLEALDWLKGQGCTQFLFKYCSTFDSTADGNIGPVAEALANALEAPRAVFCPAFPSTGRAVFQGHLFVGDRLLSESGMQNHPLTPMTDPDLRRVLAKQSQTGVGHVPLAQVSEGAEAVRAAMEAEQAEGRRFIVADAITDPDLMTLGAALADDVLITGGSGIALGLPANFRARGEIGEATGDWSGEAGKAAILSGSCSIATRGQVARHKAQHPAREITAEDVLDGRLTPEDMADWLAGQEGLPLAYSSADPDIVRATQDRHGTERVAGALEAFFAATARALTARGVRRLITAGGETSGAVVEGLGLTALSIGPEIAPGVPAVRASDDLVLALKSGNFGGEDFFAEAAAVLEGAA
ncbi:3-oxo-tetronate kinase [Thalassococcus sp. S3]|uniref:3-oxo-tetronate kinase n=1 Tax=Thalassococcus sp. S3 TaxID=2017482 RepID=UPI0010246C12|nr:3-oxo-tetronate kinase [Thalassococcus sp. S3]QBF34293.1 hypothetical protein CFI11_24210 [Thalassococcus sp. S3]